MEVPRRRSAASATGVAATSVGLPGVTSNAHVPLDARRGGDNLAVSRGWLGQVEDRVDGATGTGLTYLHARYYDPASMQFISPDPLVNPCDPMTLDPYRYADNNPVVFTDASGWTPTCWGTNLLSVNACLAKCESTNVPTQVQRTKGKYFYDAVTGVLDARANNNGSQQARGGKASLSDYEALKRSETEASYRVQCDARRVRQRTAQSAFDDVTVTSALERAVAKKAILDQGATLFTGDPACENLMGCFVGADWGCGHVTLGFTIWAGSQNGSRFTKEKQAHEYAHVLDIETVGSVSFYGRCLSKVVDDYVANLHAGWHDSNHAEIPGSFAEEVYEANGLLVRFGQDDVIVNSICRSLDGSSCGCPKQTFGGPMGEVWDGKVLRPDA